MRCTKFDVYRKVKRKTVNSNVQNESKWTLFNGCYNSELCFNAVEMYWTWLAWIMLYASAIPHVYPTNKSSLLCYRYKLLEIKQTLKKNLTHDENEKSEKKTRHTNNTYSNWQCVKQSMIRSIWCSSSVYCYWHGNPTERNYILFVNVKMRETQWTWIIDSTTFTKINRSNP